MVVQIQRKWWLKAPIAVAIVFALLLASASLIPVTISGGQSSGESGKQHSTSLLAYLFASDPSSDDHKQVNLSELSGKTHSHSGDSRTSSRQRKPSSASTQVGTAHGDSHTGPESANASSNLNGQGVQQGGSSTRANASSQASSDSPESGENSESIVRARLVTQAGTPAANVAAQLKLTMQDQSSLELSLTSNEFGVTRRAVTGVIVGAQQRQADQWLTIPFTRTDSDFDLGDIVVPASSAISGLVVGHMGAVAGASLALQLRSGGVFRSVQALKSEASGRFTTQALDPGEYRIYAEAHGYRAAYATSLAPGGEVTIQLEAASTISGRVTDAESGAAVAGAAVEVRFDGEPAMHYRFTATTRADGSFTCQCMAESALNRVAISKPGYHTWTNDFVQADTSDLEVKLPRNGNSVISGTLTLDDATSPNAARVIVRNSGTNAQLRAMNFTWNAGEAASFTIDFNPKGATALTLSIEGIGFVTFTTPVALGVGESIDLGALILSRGKPLIVQVYESPRGQYQTDKPIHNANVSVAPTNGVATQKTDSNGVATFYGVPPGPVEVTTSKLGFGLSMNSLEVTGNSAATTIDVYLERDQRQISGVVSDATTAQPIPDATLTWINHTSTAFSDSDGRFSLTYEDPGKLQLRVTAKGYQQWQGTAKVGEELLVQLIPGNSISGKFLRTDNDAPVPAGTPLEVYNASGAQIGSVSTTDDGSYRSEIYQTGTYFVGSRVFRLLPRKVTLPEDGGATLELRTRATITVRGRMVQADGTAHGNVGFYVFTTTHAGVFDTIYTDGSGGYEIRHLWPGSFTLAVLKSPSDQASQFFLPLMVASGNDTQTIDLRLPPANARVTGRVSYPDGSPVVGARVSITNRDLAMPRAVLAAYTVTDAEGRYTALRIAENARVIARVGGYADSAGTALAFSDDVMTGGSGSISIADLVVERRGASVSVPHRTADGTPFFGSEITGILYDSQGRRAGNFFGGVLRDLSPGVYTYRAYSAGYIFQPVTITVNSPEAASISGPATCVLDPDFG